MDNRCPKCRRRFSGDLRFCPQCMTPATPPRTTSWNYRESEALAHREPLQEGEARCHRHNAYVLLCCAILLVLVWSFGALGTFDLTTHGGGDWTPYDWTFLALFVIWAITLAWRGQRSPRRHASSSMASSGMRSLLSSVS